MIAIVLAAGYGTRLQNIIGILPKGLIEIRGLSLLDRLCNELEKIPSMESIIIVSNDLYYPQMTNWINGRSKTNSEIVLINNGTRSSKERLGAVGDLELAIRNCSVSGPIFVAASDCFFTFPLEGMLDCFKRRGGNWIAVAREADQSVLVDGAEIEIDSLSNITYMREKPTHPRSNLGPLPFYIFEESSYRQIEKFLIEGGNPDSPGRFPEWLHKRRKISAYIIDDLYECRDIGTPSAYDSREEI